MRCAACPKRMQQCHLRRDATAESKDRALGLCMSKDTTPFLWPSTAHSAKIELLGVRPWLKRPRFLPSSSSTFILCMLLREWARARREWCNLAASKAPIREKESISTLSSGSYIACLSCIDSRINERVHCTSLWCVNYFKIKQFIWFKNYFYLRGFKYYDISERINLDKNT